MKEIRFVGTQLLYSQLIEKVLGIHQLTRDMRQRFCIPAIRCLKVKMFLSNPGLVRCASTDSTIRPTSSLPRSKGLLQFLFEKPNVGFRAKLPLSERELEKLCKSRPLFTRLFYQKFKFQYVVREFNAESDIIKELSNVNHEIDTIKLDRAAPDVGSIVEACLRDGSIVFGVVIESLHGKFTEDMNTLKVLTADGLFPKVRPSEITFHIPNFYNKNALLKILQSPLKLSLLQQVQYSMILFIHYCMDTDERLHKAGVYDTLYLKLSSNSSMRSFTMAKSSKIMSAAKEFLPKRSLTNFALVFLIHYHAVNTPEKFVFYRPSVNVRLSSNNTVQSWKSYHAIPRFTSETIGKIDKMSTDSVRDFQSFVLYMYEDSLKTKRLGPNVINVLYYKKNKYLLIFQFLNFYIKYPHPALEPLIRKFFNGNSSVKRVSDFLKGLYIHEAVGTDELLSSQLFGSNHTSLSTTKADQILPKIEFDSISFTTSVPSSCEIPYVDHFQNLRKDVTLEMSDVKVFGIPSNEAGLCELAVSVFKKNSRDWVFNFHIPDVGSCIAPHSGDQLFTKILKRPIGDDVQLPNGSLRYLPDGIKQFLRFKNDGKRKNCLTVSFVFNRRDPEKVWKNLQPTIRLDTIQDMELLSQPQLSYCMGSMSPLTFSSELSNIDLTPVGDLVQMLKSSRKYRRQNSCLDPSFPRQKIVANDDEISFESVPTTEIHKFFDEIHLLIDTLAGKFCEDINLPIYYHTQDIIDDVPDCRNESDQSLLYPLTKISPNLFNSIENITKFRHFSGTLVASAFFWALEFLDFEQIHFSPPVSKSCHKYHGVNNSLVKISRPLHHLEQLVNQWQLLKYFNKESTTRDDSKLLLEGYCINDFDKVLNTKDKRPQITLASFYENVIEEKRQFLENLLKRSKVQWIIKYLKQLHGIKPRQYEERCGELVQKFYSDYFPETADDYFLLLKCVVTKSNSASSEAPAFATVYCIELGIEAELLLLPGTSASIGDRMICTTIVYLNEIEEQLILL